MSAIDELLRNAAAYAAAFDNGALSMLPARRVVVITCIDARINPYAILGLGEGDAHLIRNAGGVVCEDVIRSLAVSQRLLRTREVMLIHHTDCGMLKVRDDEFRAAIEEEVGIAPRWAVDTTSDIHDNVRQSVARIVASPFLPHRDAVRGFVYHVEDGSLEEVGERPLGNIRKVV